MYTFLFAKSKKYFWEVVPEYHADWHQFLKVWVSLFQVIGISWKICSLLSLTIGEKDALVSAKIFNINTYVNVET